MCWNQEMPKTANPRSFVDLQLFAGLLCMPFLCLGQQVTLPQCPQFSGTLQVSASCIADVTDIVFDGTGTAWIADNSYKGPGRILRLPGIRVGQVPSSSQTADLVLGKPNFTTLTNSSCQACSIDVPVKLAFDSQGALWVADQNSSGFAPPMLHRFSPPFTNGQAADLVAPASYAAGGMVFDANGNLWIASPYSCGSVVRYSPPFSATMQPNLVLGQPSTSSSSCVSSPGPNVLSGVQGLAFGLDGSLFVGDTASNRIAVFKPPFQTFMHATFAIGQADLSSYQPVPFAQGGLPDIVGLAIDPSGKLWVLNNNHQYLSVYSPPFSTGMARDSWFDFVTGQTSNGSSFPYTFHGFSSIRFTPDSSLWFASSGTYSGLGAIAVLTPSVLQQAELPPVQVVLPQFAFGGGWYSALYFTNTGTSAVSFTVNVVADSGTPLIVPSVSGSSTTVNLAARGTAIIEAPNVGALNQGYVSLFLPSAVQGYGIFRQSVQGIADQEAVVPFSGGTSATSTLIWDDTNFVTAVAIVNLSSLNNNVSIILRDSTGATIGTSSVGIAAQGKLAMALRDLPGLGSITGNRGSADFTVPVGNIAVLGLRFNGAAFTSIPTTQR